MLQYIRSWHFTCLLHLFFVLLYQIICSDVANNLIYFFFMKLSDCHPHRHIISNDFNVALTRSCVAIARISSSVRCN